MEDFGFAFNDRNSSDILLRIEILSHSPVAASQPSSPKRIRLDRDVASDGNILNGSMGSLKVQRVTNFHACTIVLAARSRYFYKVIKEDGGPLTIQIKDTGKSHSPISQHHIIVLMCFCPMIFELGNDEMSTAYDFYVVQRKLQLWLNYLYLGTISSTSFPDLMNLLSVADKFGVASCVESCSKLLCNISMDFQLALQCLDLLSRVTLPENLEPLTNAVKQFLLASFKDITRLRDEVMELPLVQLEMILSFDNLCEGVEETVFSIVLKWAQSHYPEFGERKKILCSRLIPCILSPAMTLECLTKIFASNDLDQQHSEVVLEALCSKVGVRCHIS